LGDRRAAVPVRDVLGLLVFEVESSPDEVLTVLLAEHYGPSGWSKRANDSLLLDALNPCWIGVIALADHAGPRVIRMGFGHRT
jgi:hypothetical protein